MNTWKVILATMLIFGTGVVTGGLLVQNSLRSRDRHNPQHAQMPQRLVPTASTPAALSRFDLLRRAERELDLTPEQRGPIELIIKDGQDRMRKLTETVIEPRRRQELRRTVEEMRQVLTPEQRARFDQLLKQQQRPRDQRKQAQPKEPAPGIPAESVPPATNSATNS